jgi:hypothetical protein
MITKAVNGACFYINLAVTGVRKIQFANLQKLEYISVKIKR